MNMFDLMHSVTALAERGWETTLNAEGLRITAERQHHYQVTWEQLCMGHPDDLDKAVAWLDKRIEQHAPA